MYLCMCVCVYVCVYVCMCVCVLPASVTPILTTNSYHCPDPFSQQTATIALTHSHNKQLPSPWPILTTNSYHRPDPFSQQTATTALTHSHNKQPPSPWSTWSSLLHDKNRNFKSHLYSLWTPVAHCGKHNYISLWKRKQWAQLNLHVWWSVQSALFMLQPKSVLIVGRGISSARRILWTWVASTWEVFQIASQLRLYNCNIHT